MDRLTVGRHLPSAIHVQYVLLEDSQGNTASLVTHKAHQEQFGVRLLLSNADSGLIRRIEAYHQRIAGIG